MATLCTAAATATSSSKCYFKAALYWQRVHAWHVADAGLEFRMNFTTNVNEARFPGGVNIENGPPERLAQMRARARKIVPDADGRDDSAALEKRLCDAATWGQHDKIGEILETCYVTRAVAVPALVEAASKGNVECVRELITADAGLAFDVYPKYGKNAFHAAAERGHEEVLKLLVRCARNRAEIYGIKDSSRRLSAFGLLRANDMSGIARRVSLLAKRLFPPLLRSRQAKIADAQCIFQLVNRAYSLEIGDEGLAFKTTNRFDTIDEVNEMIDCFCLLVEEDDEEAAGKADEQEEQEEVGRVARERIVAVSGVVNKNEIGTFGPFAVDPLDQRRGLGAKLLVEKEKCLLALGCTKIQIDVVNHRIDLFPFYKKHGYTVTEETREMFADNNHKVTKPDVLTCPSHYVVLTKYL